MDSNLDYIRQQFKSYENNMDNEKGCHHLENALECAMEVIKNSNNDEVRISYNYINKHLEKTINKAHELISTSPNSKQLCAIYNSMESFIDCGFDDIPDCFMTIKGKILKLWVDVSMNEDTPSEIELANAKKEIYEKCIVLGVSAAIASEATGFPMVRTANGVRPLTNDEKEEWCCYMKNKR